MDASCRRWKATASSRAKPRRARARQGVTGHNVRYVLMAGTLGVIVLFVIVYATFFGA